MEKKIPHLKKKLHGFITNESGSIKRETIVKLSVGGAMIAGGIIALPDPVSAHLSSTWNPCFPKPSTPAINNSSIGVVTSFNRNGHFNGAGSTTHANVGHGNYETACFHTSHSSHGSCGSGCW